MRHLILVCVALITAVHTKTKLESCFDAADPNTGCCVVDVGNAVKNTMKECEEKFPNNDNCDLETCYVEKKGFLFSNGTVDMSKLEHILEADLVNYSDIFTTVKQKCLKADITDYAEKCYAKQLINCLSFFVLANCPKWSDEQRCRKIQSASEECAKMLT